MKTPKLSIANARYAVMALCAFLSVSLTSCNILGPKYHEYPGVLSFVFLSNIDSDYYDSIVTEFTNDVVLGNVEVPGYTSYKGAEPDNLDAREYADWIWCDALIEVFSDCIDFTYEDSSQFKEQYTENWEDLLKNYKSGWYGFFESEQTIHAAQTLAKDYDRAKKDLNALFDSFNEYCASYAVEQVSVLNWEFEAKTQADSYTGYLITYEIGEGYFVLAHLIEFSDSNRYRIKIIYSGDSLSELSDHIE